MLRLFPRKRESVITWLMAAAVAYASVNRFFRRNTGPSSRGASG
jgi:hypothetical protein